VNSSNGFVFTEIDLTEVHIRLALMLHSENNVFSSHFSVFSSFSKSSTLQMLMEKIIILSTFFFVFNGGFFKGKLDSKTKL